MSVAGATAYFGFGALMNKISLRMRGICPQSSCAAKLPGFCLVFGGSHGMATVLRSKTDAVHGVLYMVSCEEKKRLDSTESSYEELEAHVETRNGELVLCTLNVMRPDVMENFYETLPSERYLAVMIEGATQHNLPASWIEMLRRTGCVPRSLYRSFPVSSELSLFTPAQLREMKGLTFAINGKILRADSAPSHVQRQVMTYGPGRDHTLMVAQEYYEPLYGEPGALESLTKEHRAFCEHQLVVQYCSPTGETSLEPIGFLTYTETL